MKVLFIVLFVVFKFSCSYCVAQSLNGNQIPILLKNKWAVVRIAVSCEDRYYEFKDYLKERDSFMLITTKNDTLFGKWEGPNMTKFVSKNFIITIKALNREPDRYYILDYLVGEKKLSFIRTGSLTMTRPPISMYTEYLILTKAK